MKKWIGVAAWIVIVGVGMQFLWSYENRAAQSVRALLRMPADHRVALDSAKPTVIVFAHPHCPCSRASIAQLERVVGTYADRFAVRVCFYAPKDKDQAWVKSDLYQRATTMPGAQVIVDPEGQEAKKFKATTSGEVFVYSSGADLLYHGGLTSARGHEGDSLGTQSLSKIAQVGHSDVMEAAVFGCTLYQGTKQTLGGS